MIKIVSGFLFGVMLLGQAVLARAENPSPEQVINSATAEVMVIIEEAKSYYDNEPQRYFEKIEAVLDAFVDFDDFSRAVMAGFASQKRLESLQGEDRQRAEEQIERFGAVFKAGLVQTYGKGFLAFGGERVEIVESRLSPDGADAQVLQLVHGIAEKPYEVRYALHKDDRGNWRLRNVIIGAINLGKIYRNQFLNAAKKYQGDVDQVIDNWVVEDTAA